ncbi:hypothetical protein [Mucilaginibacter sp.]|uniref:hypothetical protein n=1 Tax=Mucilaginibacter sp. TaxID=1882438 RepID=UPI0026358C70|nr:hypothetical protein [Mucilaginibacter sp.]MDB4922472.1 hypothetical protein [Mucilaginibacter sp.]
MKTESTKSTAKQAQVTAKKNIQTSLIAELKAFAVKLGHSSKKINKEIEKAAKLLSKKLSKPVKADKSAIPKPAKKKAALVAKAPKPIVTENNAPAVDTAPKPIKKVAAEKSTPAKKTGK